MPKLVGVVGGIGPAATVAFLDRIVKMTRASRDQDHVNLVVSQYSATPDRTDFLLGKSDENPGPALRASAQMLERCGVDFLSVPCNTASFFMTKIARAVSIEVIGIVPETVADVVRQYPNAQKIGVLATEGTARSHVYSDELVLHGKTAVQPRPTEQKQLNAIIYNQVKANRPDDVATFHGVISSVFARCDVVILGCTELSVAPDLEPFTEKPVIDSLDSLARSTILKAGHELNRDSGPTGS